MALTPSSFQPDPRRRVLIRAISGFYVEGREKPVLEDEVVELPYGQAIALIHSSKALQWDGDPKLVGTRIANPDRDRREKIAANQLCPTCWRPLGDHADSVPSAGAAANKGGSTGSKS